jgi:chromosome segregation ATPase
VQKELAEARVEELDLEISALREQVELLEVDKEIYLAEREELELAAAASADPNGGGGGGAVGAEALETQNAQLKAALSRLRDAALNEREELAAARARVTELSGATEALAKLRGTHETVKTQLEETQAQLEDALALESMVTELTERNLALGETIAARDAVVRDLEEMRDLNEEMEAVSAESITALEEELTATQAAQSRLQGEIRDLGATVEDRDASIAKYRDRLRELAERCKEMEQRGLGTMAKGEERDRDFQRALDENVRLKTKLAGISTDLARAGLEGAVGRGGALRAEMTRSMLPVHDFETELAAVEAHAVAAEARLKCAAVLSTVSQARQSGQSGQQQQPGQQQQQPGQQQSARQQHALSAGDGLAALLRSAVPQSDAARADLAHLAQLAHAAAIADVSVGVYAAALASADKDTYAKAVSARSDAGAMATSLGTMLRGWGTAAAGMEPQVALKHAAAVRTAGEDLLRGGSTWLGLEAVTAACGTAFVWARAAAINTGDARDDDDSSNNNNINNNNNNNNNDDDGITGAETGDEASPDGDADGADASAATGATAAALLSPRQALLAAVRALHGSLAALVSFARTRRGALRISPMARRKMASVHTAITAALSAVEPGTFPASRAEGAITACAERIAEAAGTVAEIETLASTGAMDGDGSGDVDFPTTEQMLEAPKSGLWQDSRDQTHERVKSAMAGLGAGGSAQAGAGSAASMELEELREKVDRGKMEMAVLEEQLRVSEHKVSALDAKLVTMRGNVAEGDALRKKVDRLENGKRQLEEALDELQGEILKLEGENRSLREKARGRGGNSSGSSSSSSNSSNSSSSNKTAAATAMGVKGADGAEGGDAAADAAAAAGADGNPAGAGSTAAGAGAGGAKAGSRAGAAGGMSNGADLAPLLAALRHATVARAQTAADHARRVLRDELPPLSFPSTADSGAVRIVANGKAISESVQSLQRTSHDLSLLLARQRVVRLSEPAHLRRAAEKRLHSALLEATAVESRARRGVAARVMGGAW